MAEAAEQAKVTALRKAEPAARGSRSRPHPARAATAAAAAARALDPADRRAARWSSVAIGWFWLTGGRYRRRPTTPMSRPTWSTSRPTSPGWSSPSTVQDNQQVRKGQVLFTLDDSTYRSA